MLTRFRSHLDRFVFTPYFTPRKLANLIRANISYKLRKEVVSSFPYQMVVDPCNSCILRCPLCPTGKHTEGRKKSMMKYEQFASLLDEVGAYLYEIYLYNWGESLLNSDIFRMIEHAHNRRIRTKLSSSLNYFKEGFADQLVTSGLDELIISLDGLCQETYEQYRRGGDFNTVVGAVKEISAAKKRLHSKTPTLVWQFLVMRQNEHEVRDVPAFARELGVDDVRITPIRTDTAQEIFETDEQKIENSKQWLPEKESLSRFSYSSRKRVAAKRDCKYLWSMPAINPNGSLSPCCAVFPEKLDFGNVLEEGFRNVWNNEKYVSARRVVAGKKATVPTVCINCVRNGFI